jgi:hypothetical protein
MLRSKSVYHEHNLFGGKVTSYIYYTFPESQNVFGENYEMKFSASLYIFKQKTRKKLVVCGNDNDDDDDYIIIIVIIAILLINFTKWSRNR